MDTRIIAALITSGVGIAGVVLAWILSNLKFSPSPKAKRRSLEGSWRGETQQDNGPGGTPITVDLVIELKTSWRKISGTGRVQGGGDELNLELHGGYRELDHIYLEYSSAIKSKINFGCVLLKLNGNGDELIGKIIGYGNMSQALIKGDMRLKKI